MMRNADVLVGETCTPTFYDRLSILRVFFGCHESAKLLIDTDMHFRSVSPTTPISDRIATCSLQKGSDSFMGEIRPREFVIHWAYVENHSTDSTCGMRSCNCTQPANSAKVVSMDQ